MEKIAKAYVKHFYNEKGEQLAKIEDSEAFQHVYDYHGDQKRRHKLVRKLEQVHSNYNIRSHLFQKVFYVKGLTLADERVLRQVYEQERSRYESEIMAGRAVAIGVYLPFTYVLSANVRPTTVGLSTLAFYYVYRNYQVPMQTNMFQRRLNKAASQLAEKYNIHD